VIQELLGITQSQMKTIGGAIFAYLFHRPNFTQRDLIAYINNKETSTRIIGVIRREGTLLKNCKLYAWAAFKHRFYDDVKPQYKNYGLDRSDALFLSKLNLGHLDKQFPSFSLVDFDSLVEQIVYGPKMKAYIGRYISKVMTFLIRSYGVKREDLQAEMQIAAVRALYIHYPRFETLLHFENVAKTTIHNTGQTLIMYHTSPSRQRLEWNSVKGDFEQLQVAMQHAVEISAADPYLYHVKDSIQSLVKLSTRMSPEVQRFLLCCAGQHDKEFSEFLGTDNSILVDEVAWSRYMSKTRKFFNVSEEQVNLLFEKLRQKLS